MKGLQREAPVTRSALEDVFRRAPGPLLMPYAVGGYPDLASCLEILRAYCESGVRLLELGIPFSDPLADGPVIQGASHVALSRGVRPADILALAAEISREGVAVVLLSYLNTILAYGGERFFTACSGSGVLGVVVPDLPVEEAAELQAVARAHGVDVVLLAAPTSTDERLARIGAAASGFVYCVSTTGVTGARDSLDPSLPALLQRLREHTQRPLAVGFGVSTPAQAGAVAAHADGVIVGSALVRAVAESETLREGLDQVRSLLREMQAAMVAGRATG